MFPPLSIGLGLILVIMEGGALFAAFPKVYATSFSGFYIAMMLLLFDLIFRAVTIEFRSKQTARWWRQLWDVCFSISSIVSTLLIGVALGNIAHGIPLDSSHEFAGTFFGLPLVIAYTSSIYYIFRGKVKLNASSH